MIVAHRLRLGLTQESLAEKAGLSERSLRRLEAGQIRTPRMSSVALLVAALGLHGAERERFTQAAYAGPDSFTAAPRPVPRQLPADVRAFTGRADELAELERLLAEPATDAGSPPVIVAVTGTAGVGKTGLVVHWAHRARDRFPDGQLYLDLRGHDADRPMEPAEALTRLLLSLGVGERDIPIDPAERVDRYRFAASDRRVLIVLDNAVSAEQIRPLLPGTGPGAVLITSRDSVAGLVAVHGAHRMDLDLLPEADAALLLRRLIGGRVDAEPAAAATLIQQCARLPLALRIAAELASARPARSLADLVRELAEHRDRLELLDAGGYAHADVTTVFSWSLRRLPAAAVRTFRLLGLHPGPGFDAYAAAALTGAGLQPTRAALRLLARANLIRAGEHDHYGMHDLLRAYAGALAAADTGTDAVDAARERLLDYYLAAAAAAMDGLFPAERHRRPPPPPRPPELPRLDRPSSARRWLDDERATLVVMTEHAARHGRAGHSARMSATLFRYLAGGLYSDGLVVHEHARRAARAAGDGPGEGHALLGLIDAHVQLGSRQAAAELAERALSLFRRAAEPSGEARARYSLGMIEWMSGRYDRALDHAGPALAIAGVAGDEIGEAKAHSLVGLVALNQSRLTSAQACFEAAVTLYRRHGDHSGEAYTLHNLGCVEQARGRHRPAAELHRRALALFAPLGDRAGQAMALDGLAIAHTGLDELDEAEAALLRALAIAREIGDRRTEPVVLNSLGELARRAGRPAESAARHAAASAVAAAVDDPYEEARAQACLGDACREWRRPDEARSHYARALELYERLDVPEAGRVRSRLDELYLGANGRTP
ncbi:tetratricopeptide repeat protein [Dactylosporangium sp. NPDC051541]|uniref:tetratricopeptide repeat protein n=1 Tax=Dactylosporangium sp. NPDC051541 TaxID=3363977 RepID=UPI00379ADCBC